MAWAFNYVGIASLFDNCYPASIATMGPRHTLEYHLLAVFYSLPSK